MSTLCQDCVRIASKLYPTFVWIVSGLCQDFVNIVSEDFYVCVITVSVLLNSVRMVSGLCQGSFMIFFYRNISGFFEDCIIILSCVCQNYVRNVPGLCQDCIRMVL